MTHHRVRGARPRSDTNVFIKAPVSTFVSPSAFWRFPGSNMALTDAGCMLVPWHMSRANGRTLVCDRLVAQLSKCHLVVGLNNEEDLWALSYF